MGGFPETRWSLVLRAASGQPEVARTALNELLAMYADPVDRYLRATGIAPQDVPDARQEFFLDLVGHGAMGRFDRDKTARFRSFMIGALRNHRGRAREHEMALKRNRGQSPASLQGLQDGEFSSGHKEPVAASDPEREFMSGYAAALIRRAVDRLAEESAELGRSREFEEYVAFLTSDEEPKHSQIALRLGISGLASRTRLRRLRQHFHETVRDCVAETLVDRSDVEDELRRLLS